MSRGRGGTRYWTDLLSDGGRRQGDGSFTTETVSALPDELPQEMVEQVLALARTLREPDARCAALRAVAGRLAGPARDGGLREAWTRPAPSLPARCVARDDGIAP
jgi:hypothetical protein